MQLQTVLVFDNAVIEWAQSVIRTRRLTEPSESDIVNHV